MYENLKKEVELVWEDHDHIRDDQAKIAIRETVRLLVSTDGDTSLCELAKGSERAIGAKICWAPLS